MTQSPRRVAAFLRAVNVGGTGKLPMAQLRDLVAGLGYADVKTHLASGNVMFTSDAPLADLAQSLEGALNTIGLNTTVMMRDAGQMAAILDDLPFDAPNPSQLLILLMPDAVTPADLAVRRQAHEVIHAGSDHIYIHYAGGMGASKLVLAGAARGTMRNLNTIRAVAADLGVAI